MRATHLNIGLFVTLLYLTLGTAIQTRTDQPERAAKHFSLFSVVTFKNEECTSDSSLTGGARQGTCYTATECSDKSGTKSGNCASGFGVCCLFLNNGAATVTISENRTYLRNAEFPSTATATTAQSIVYTINKMNDDICQLRFDFVVFTIAGPGNTLETIVGGTANTHCTNDVINFAQTGGFAVSPLCGTLTDEHLYVDMGALSTDTSVVTLATAATGTPLTPAIAARVWDIKTSQIECFATYRAPPGCHRYMMTDSGKVINYNFRSISTGAYLARGGANLQNSGFELANQNVNTCIRRSKGMCCVEYQLCTSYNGIALVGSIAGSDVNGATGLYAESWSIDTISSLQDTKTTQANSGMIDAMCTNDYVEIPSSWSGACGNSPARATINTRYCGAQFGANLQLASNTAATPSMSTPVCDCSEPFVVRNSSDLATDLGGTANATGAQANTNILVEPRGFCLDFTQRPCYF